MKAGSFRVLPTAVTPENAPLSDRNGNFQELLKTFEIASFKKHVLLPAVQRHLQAYHSTGIRTRQQDTVPLLQRHNAPVQRPYPDLSGNKKLQVLL